MPIQFKSNSSQILSKEKLRLKINRSKQSINKVKSNQIQIKHNKWTKQNSVTEFNIIKANSKFKFKFKIKNKRTF